MKKKVALTAAAVALVGTLAVGGTLAWFTDTETATNVVTIGNLDVLWNEGEVKDPQGNVTTPGKDITGKDDLGNDITGLEFGVDQVPGASFAKNAKIKNVGHNKAYVRAKISYQIDTVNDDGSVTTGNKTQVVYTPNENNNNILEDNIPEQYEVEIKKSDSFEAGAWVYDDGYFYYTSILNGKTGDEIDATELLVGEVSIADNASQADIANKKFNIILEAEAIQADHVLVDEATGAEKEAATLDDLKTVFSDKVLGNQLSGEQGN